MIDPCLLGHSWSAFHLSNKQQGWDCTGGRSGPRGKTLTWPTITILQSPFPYTTNARVVQYAQGSVL